jgi:hypothetical protein
MPLDAETGIYTFDDGPEIRDLAGMYESLRRDLTDKPPESGLPEEDQARRVPSTFVRAIRVS